MSSAQIRYFSKPANIVAVVLSTEAASSYLVQSHPPMAFAVAIGSGASGSGAGVLCGNTTTGTPCTPLSHLSLSSSSRRNLLLVVSAKKLSSRSRRNLPTTTDEEPPQKTFNEFPLDAVDDRPFFSKLPGSEPDFFEGPQWDTFGFIGEYIWVLGVVFAV